MIEAADWEIEARCLFMLLIFILLTLSVCHHKIVTKYFTMNSLNYINSAVGHWQRGESFGQSERLFTQPLRRKNTRTSNNGHARLGQFLKTSVSHDHTPINRRLFLRSPLFCAFPKTSVWGSRKRRLRVAERPKRIKKSAFWKRSTYV